MLYLATDGMPRLATASNFKAFIMKKNYLLLGFIAILLFSCKKDKSDTPETPTPIESSDTFEFFKIGNRWEYFRFQIYQDGDTTHQAVDTTYFPR